MKKYQFSSDYKRNKNAKWEKMKKILMLSSGKIEQDPIKLLKQQQKVGNLPCGIYHDVKLLENSVV